MHSEFRWQQRFSHYQKALVELKTALENENFSNLERAGVIQLFEVSFELAWKTLKDKLFYEGYNVDSPRSVIKKSFEMGLIADGQIWLEMLESRNLYTHTYSGKLAEEAIESIRNYSPLLFNLEKILEQK